MYLVFNSKNDKSCETESFLNSWLLILFYAWDSLLSYLMLQSIGYCTSWYVFILLFTTSTFYSLRLHSYSHIFLSFLLSSSSFSWLDFFYPYSKIFHYSPEFIDAKKQNTEIYWNKGARTSNMLILRILILYSNFQNYFSKNIQRRHCALLIHSVSLCFRKWCGMIRLDKVMYVPYTIRMLGSAC